MLILFCSFLMGIVFGEQAPPSTAEALSAPLYEETSIALLDFSREGEGSGWIANPWGGGSCSAKVIQTGDTRFPAGLEISFSETKATVYNRELFERLRESWQGKTPAGFYLWLKSTVSPGAQIHVQYQTCDEDGRQYEYVRHLGLLDGDWQCLHVALGGFPVGRHEHPFRIAELRQILFVVYGTGRAVLGELGIDCRHRRLPDAEQHPQTAWVNENRDPITIDGNIGEAAWGNAFDFELSLQDRNDRRCRGEAPEDRTQGFLTWNHEGVYGAARCFKKNMNELRANYTVDTPDIWHDECIEFYFDPGRTMHGLKKYAINANGHIGAHDFAHDQNQDYRVAVRKLTDSWAVEFFISWTALGGDRMPPSVMGFNMTRTTYDNTQMKERSGWTTGIWNALADFGVAVLSRGMEADAGSSERWFLARSGQGQYLLTSQSPDRGSRDYWLRVYGKTGKAVTAEDGRLPAGETRLPFGFAVNSTGSYNVEFLIYNANGTVQDFFEAIVTEDVSDTWTPLPVDAFCLFPEPKIFRQEEGMFSFSKRTLVFSGAPDQAFCAEKLIGELRTFYEVDLEDTDEVAPADIVIDLDRADSEVHVLLEDLGLAEEFGKVKDDGFLLAVRPERILVTAKEKRGLLYGVTALCDLVKITSGDLGPACVHSATVVDWPDNRERFFHQMMGAFGHAQKDEPGFFDTMLERFPLHFRYNGFLFQVDDYYQWQCAPRMRRRTAWTPDDYRSVIAFVNRHFAPVLPSVQSHGHMNWWLFGPDYGFNHLMEDGNPEVLCTRHPETYKTLFAFYDEAIRLCSENPEYAPKYFFASLDEVRWHTDEVPEEKRCRYCAGVPKNEIFRDHVKRIDDYVRGRGLRLMMCTDMLVEEHNGLNQFKCTLIRDQLPRDIVMCHWSKLDYPSIARFAELGFENRKFSTSYQVDRLNENLVRGHALNICTYNWWLPITRCQSQSTYGPMAIALYANAIWNLFPDDDDTSWRKYERIYGNWLMRNWSRKPLLHATQDVAAIDLSAVVNETVVDVHAGDGRGWFDKGADRDLSGMKLSDGKFAGIPLSFCRKTNETQCLKLAAQNQESVEIVFDRQAASLILLHAADLDSKNVSAFRDRKNYHDWLRGQPLVRYTVNYADGQTEVFEALLGWNVGLWNFDPMKRGDVFAKYVPDARSLIEGRTRSAETKKLPPDIALYLYEWVNPRPGIPIRSIHAQGVGGEVSYALLALSTRGYALRDTKSP